MSNINQHFNGKNSLAYLGVNAVEPTNFIVQKRDPLTTDFRNVVLGTWWLNSSTHDLFYLAALDNNIATWIKLFISSALATLTGDTGGPVGPDGAGNINIFSAFPGISVDGNPGTNTLTINGSTLTDQYDTDSGTAIPAAGILTIHGALNIGTTGAGNTVTILTDTVSEGVMYADGSGVYTSLSTGNNGQTLIASTAGIPAWANITSTGATITITNGANSINLESTTPPSGISVAFSAYQSATIANATGDGTQYFYIADTELFDLTGDYDNTTGIFTAPANGDYLFNMTCAANYVSVATNIPIVMGFLTSTPTTYAVMQNAARFAITPYQNGGSVVLPMTAGMTIKPYVTVSTLPKTVSIVGSINLITAFSGFKFNI